MNFITRGGAVVTAACLLGMVLALHVRGQDAGKPELLIHTGHPFRVSSLDFSSDGKLLASGSWDNTVKLWDVESGRVIRTLNGHGQFVYSVSFSPDDKTLASASKDKTIKLWRLDTLAEPLTIQTAGEIQTVEFSPDGATLAGAGQDGVIRLWDALSGAVRESLPGHSHYVYSMTLSGNGRWLASSSLSEIKLWDLKTGKGPQRLEWCSNRIDSVAFSPDSKTLAASCGGEGTALLWNVETGGQQTLRMHERGGHSVQFSPNGSLLGSSSNDDIKLYNLATGQTRSLEGDTSRIDVIRFSPDGKSLVGGSDEGELKFWLLETGKQERTRFLRGEPGRFPLVETAVFSPDGETLAVGLGNGSIRTWGLKEGAGSQGRLAHNNRVNSVVFTPDNKFLLSASPDRTLKIWDMSAGGEPKVLSGYLHALTSEAFSPDGKLVATDSDDGVRLWDLSTGVSRVVKKLSDEVYSITFSPDGKRLAVSYSNSATLLDIETGSEQVIHRDHGGVLSVIRISPNGTKAIQGDVDHSISIRDISGAGRPQTLKGGSDWATRFVFDRDGRYLASISRDEIRVWDLQEGRESAVADSLQSWVKFDNLGRFPVGDVLALADGNYVKLVKLVAGKAKDELVRIYGVGEDGWVAVTPDGRFDTNLPLEDLSELSWLMPDDPLRPLPLEIFMRVYYEPQLLPRTLLDKEFSDLNLTKLNRSLPVVSITEVSPPDAGRQVRVKVEVRTPDDRNAMPTDCALKPNLCAYDLRLYRDGRLVGSLPAAGAELYAQSPVGLSRGEDNKKWSDAMLLTSRDCRPGPRAGSFECKFDVQLPLGKDAADVELTAYAFNNDRIKSLTAKWEWPPQMKARLPRAAPVKPMAYVVSFGVNSFDDPNWNLKFAVKDAQLMQEVLAGRLKQRQAAGEFEQIVGISLVSDSRRRDATKEKLQTVLELMGGKMPPKVRVAKLGELARGLKKVRPDDIVILSFSSHGYSDRNGLFYVLPSDIQSDGEKKVTKKLLSSSISSDELSLWLRGFDAEEFIIIIDACHAEAAVTGKDFKPGPMGSRGLGQLSYDKGMRVLAATRAEGEAKEIGRIAADNVIEGGLLTYALLRDGIERKMADRSPQDMKITMGEWLMFGAAQTPLLYKKWKDLVNGQPNTGGRTAGTERQSEELQHPSLFDFRRRGEQDTVLIRLP